MGWYGRRLCRLKNKDMADHFAGKKTFYFTADGRSKTAEVLVNIDIDCHKSGSLAGAIAFAEHLKATKFPDLYFEASTNGKGVHGYIVVVKGNLGDEGLNGALSILDRWLKAELAGELGRRERRGQSPLSRVHLGPGEVRVEELQERPTRQTAKGSSDQGRRASGDHPGRRGRPAAAQSPGEDVESDDSVVAAKKKSPKKPSVVSVSESENREKGASVVSPKAEESLRFDLRSSFRRGRTVQAQGRLSVVGLGASRRRGARCLGPEGRQGGGPGRLPDVAEVLHGQHECQWLIADCQME